MDPGKGNVRPAIDAAPAARSWRIPVAVATLVTAAAFGVFVAMTPPPPGVAPNPDTPILSLVHEWPQHNADPSVIGPG